MMPAPAPLLATVMHLETGHVLAAVSSGGLEPTLEELTAGDHLRVRFPGKPGFVNVPLAALTAARVAVGADVLDRSQYYVLGGGKPPLTFGPGPVFNAPLEDKAKNKQAIVVWQAGSDVIVASGQIGPGLEPLAARPPEATHELLAYAGGPLHLNDNLRHEG
jgi:hypothetical protein